MFSTAILELEKENFELKRANEILKDALGFSTRVLHFVSFDRQEIYLSEYWTMTTYYGILYKRSG